MKTADDFWVKFWATMIAILVVAAGALAWGHFVYGDWRCAFAECRIEVRS